MARLRPDKKNIPARKDPVISTRAPTIHGPVHPPISAKQKNIPAAAPKYFDPTSGTSIKIRVRMGKKEALTIPKSINPAI